MLISFSNDVLISSVQCGKLSNESKEILGGAGELAQARCVKLINIRAKVGALKCRKIYNVCLPVSLQFCPNVLSAECLSVKYPFRKTSVGLGSDAQVSFGQTFGHVQRQLQSSYPRF